MLLTTEFVAILLFARCCSCCRVRGTSEHSKTPLLPARLGHKRPGHASSTSATGYCRRWEAGGGREGH